jgi:hypothetical protein
VFIELEFSVQGLRNRRATAAVFIRKNRKDRQGRVE